MKQEINEILRSWVTLDVEQHKFQILCCCLNSFLHLKDLLNILSIFVTHRQIIYVHSNIQKICQVYHPYLYPDITL